MVTKPINGSTEVLRNDTHKKFQASYQNSNSSSEEGEQHKGEPTDRYHVVQITMYLFGITSLLPWNFFIQANDYWMYKFRNVSMPFIPVTEDKTELQATFSSYLAIASKTPYLLFLLVNAAASRRFTAEKRVRYPMVILILLFIVTTVMVYINTDDSQMEFMIITLCIVVLINAVCGFVQGGGTGIAGSLPKRYMGYNVTGMAIGGILASIAQILSLVGNASPITSACMYFVCAIVIICTTFLFFLLTSKTEFYKYYMSKQASTSLQDERLIKNENLMSSLDIFKKLWINASGLTLIFWVSLAVLPAVVVLVTSTSTQKTIWTGRLFTPIACFLIFNASDLAGRVVATYIPIPSKYKLVSLVLIVTRIVFIPLIMLCNAHPRYHLPVLFPSDASFIVIILFFALTNGYFCNIVLMQGPKRTVIKSQEFDYFHMLTALYQRQKDHLCLVANEGTEKEIKKIKVNENAYQPFVSIFHLEKANSTHHVLIMVNHL